MTFELDEFSRLYATHMRLSDDRDRPRSITASKPDVEMFNLAVMQRYFFRGVHWVALSASYGGVHAFNRREQCWEDIGIAGPIFIITLPPEPTKTYWRYALVVINRHNLANFALEILDHATIARHTDTSIFFRGHAWPCDIINDNFWGSEEIERGSQEFSLWVFSQHTAKGDYAKVLWRLNLCQMLVHFQRQIDNGPAIRTAYSHYNDEEMRNIIEFAQFPDEDEDESPPTPEKIWNGTHFCFPSSPRYERYLALAPEQRIPVDAHAERLPRHFTPPDLLPDYLIEPHLVLSRRTKEEIKRATQRVRFEHHDVPRNYTPGSIWTKIRQEAGARSRRETSQAQVAESSTQARRDGPHGQDPPDANSKRLLELLTKKPQDDGSVPLAASPTRVYEPPSRTPVSSRPVSSKIFLSKSIYPKPVSHLKPSAFSKQRLKFDTKPINHPRPENMTGPHVLPACGFPTNCNSSQTIMQPQVPVEVTMQAKEPVEVLPQPQVPVELDYTLTDKRFGGFN